MAHDPIEPEEMLTSLLEVFNTCVDLSQTAQWKDSLSAGNSAVEAAGLLMKFSAEDQGLYDTLKEGLEKIFRMAVKGTQVWGDATVKAAAGRSVALAAKALIALDKSEVKPQGFL